ncbi:MAG: CMD domain protein [Devosia sp.]
MNTSPDVIDQLAGIAPGSALSRIRAQRPAALENAQKSYDALFNPAQPGTVLLEERFAIAYFVAGLHRTDAIAAFYREKLGYYARAGLVAAISAEIKRGETTGPYGAYPTGPLSAEDKAGLHFGPDAGHADVLGRLGAALVYAHLLVFRPRDASSAALQALLNSGWSTDDIVTLSQLVAFLSFQIRVVTELVAFGTAEQRAVAAE